MKRFAVGYEFLCRIVMMVVVANVAFLVHTLLGLVVVGFFPLDCGDLCHVPHLAFGC